MSLPDNAKRAITGQLAPELQVLSDLTSPMCDTMELAREGVRASLRVESDVEALAARLASIEATQDSILAILEGMSKQPRRTRGKAD